MKTKSQSSGRCNSLSLSLYIAVNHGVDSICNLSTSIFLTLCLEEEIVWAGIDTCSRAELSAFHDITGSPTYLKKRQSYHLQPNTADFCTLFFKFLILWSFVLKMQCNDTCTRLLYIVDC